MNWAAIRYTSLSNRQSLLGCPAYTVKAYLVSFVIYVCVYTYINIFISICINIYIYISQSFLFFYRILTNIADTYIVIKLTSFNPFYLFFLSHFFTLCSFLFSSSIIYLPWVKGHAKQHWRVWKITLIPNYMSVYLLHTLYIHHM